MQKQFINLSMLACLLLQAPLAKSIYLPIAVRLLLYPIRGTLQWDEQETERERRQREQAESLQTNAGGQNRTAPQSIIAVPAPQRPELADQIKAINLPDTLGQIIKDPTGKDGTVFVNINLSGQTISETTASAQSTQISDGIEWFDRLKDTTRKGCVSTLDWIKNNKKRCFFYGTLGTYAVTQAYLWYLASTLQDHSCWSLWKHQASLEELYRCKQADLAQDVIATINSRQSTALNFTDRVTPFVTFLKETEQELAALNSYRKIITFIQNIHLSKIFFYNSQLYNESVERINRLQYIKNSVAAWLSDTQKQQQPLLLQKK